jgi:hypothetical protein
VGDCIQIIHYLQNNESAGSVRNFARFCLAMARSGFMPRQSRAGRDPAAIPFHSQLDLPALRVENIKVCYATVMRSRDRYAHFCASGSKWK